MAILFQYLVVHWRAKRQLCFSQQQCPRHDVCNAPPTALHRYPHHPTQRAGTPQHSSRVEMSQFPEMLDIVQWWCGEGEKRIPVSVWEWARCHLFIHLFVHPPLLGILSCFFQIIFVAWVTIGLLGDEQDSTWTEIYFIKFSYSIWHLLLSLI